ncbi:hypothetical protein ACFL1Y_01800 [Patescibacteria group bacterium]
MSKYRNRKGLLFMVALILVLLFVSFTQSSCSKYKSPMEPETAPPDTTCDCPDCPDDTTGGDTTDVVEPDLVANYDQCSRELEISGDPGSYQWLQLSDVDQDGHAIVTLYVPRDTAFVLSDWVDRVNWTKASSPQANDWWHEGIGGIDFSNGAVWVVNSETNDAWFWPWEPTLVYAKVIGTEGASVVLDYVMPWPAYPTPADTVIPTGTHVIEFGEHTFTVSKHGYHSQAYPFTVACGQIDTIVIVADLEPIVDPTYHLTVNNGYGSGDYTEGEMINIYAYAPTTGYHFVNWTGDTQHVDDLTNSEAMVTMPAQDIIVTATYAEDETDAVPRFLDLY